MARMKKSELSAAVGTVKRGNPDFVSSSFYVPKKVNIHFDRAILTLKANGFEVDRSDILSVLMDHFATAVDAAEQEDGEMDLPSLLAAGSERALSESAEASGLRGQLRGSLDAAEALMEKYEAAYREREKVSQEMISILLMLVPEGLREKIPARVREKLPEDPEKIVRAAMASQAD